MRINRIACGALLLGASTIAASLLVPPVRDRVFATKLWPWALPWDTNPAELELLKELARPGDVVVESNLHGWQWITLCLASTGTSWVHAALVDQNKRLLTVHKLAIEADWSIYDDWGSTRLALVRPGYDNDEQIVVAIEHARSKLGSVYDPTFRDHAGNCNGFVASALSEAGLEVETRRCWGREIYSPECFFGLRGAEIIWLSDVDRHNLRASKRQHDFSSNSSAELPQLK